MTFPRARVALAILLVSLPACGAGSAPDVSRDPASTTHTRSGGPPLVLLVMENHEYDAIVGSPDAPYLNETFIPSGTLFTNVHALHHPSLPNYLEMTSGQTSGCDSDDCPTQTYTTDNLFQQLDEAGIGWQAWQESMPSTCSLETDGGYAPKHNPPVYYAGLTESCVENDVPYPETLPARLPAFTFISPNTCSDMHDCPVSDGDAWLRDHVGPLLDAGATVIITFDEGTTDEGGGGHIMTAVVGPGAEGGTTDGSSYDHRGLLAGIEVWFGLERINGAATSTPLPLPS